MPSGSPGCGHGGGRGHRDWRLSRVAYHWPRPGGDISVVRHVPRPLLCARWSGDCSWGLRSRWHWSSSPGRSCWLEPCTTFSPPTRVLMRMVISSRRRCLPVICAVANRTDSGGSRRAPGRAGSGALKPVPHGMGQLFGAGASAYRPGRSRLAGLCGVPSGVIGVFLGLASTHTARPKLHHRGPRRNASRRHHHIGDRREALAGPGSDREAGPEQFHQ